MSNYLGVRCPVCNKKFVETDDIVVCPICGAPHHRDCYAVNNQCAFAEDHLSGKEWRDPAAEEQSQQSAQNEGQQSGSVQVCARCGSSNPQESLFCQICGNPLVANRQAQGNAQQWQRPGFHIQVDTISMIYGGLDPGSEIEGEKVHDIARYVGAGSASYLPRFKVLSETGRSISLNISAMFFGCFYFFYRKMYAVGAFLVVLYLISSIPGYLQSWELMPEVMRQLGFLDQATLDEAMITHLGQLSDILHICNAVIVMIVSLFANKYYMNRVITDVRTIRQRREQDQVEQPVYEAKLISAGGVDRSAVMKLIIAYVLLNFIISSIMLYHFM